MQHSNGFLVFIRKFWYYIHACNRLIDTHAATQLQRFCAIRCATITQCSIIVAWFGVSATFGWAATGAAAREAQHGHLATEQAEHHAAQVQAVPDQMREGLNQGKPITDGLATQLYESERRRVFTFVGAEPGIGAASVGVALLTKGPQVVAIAVEEFHHGLHIATVAEEDVVVLIAPGSSANQRFLDSARSVHTWGAYYVALIDQPNSLLGTYADSTLVLPALTEPVTPSLMLPPLHQLSLSFARGSFEPPTSHTVP